MIDPNNGFRQAVYKGLSAGLKAKRERQERELKKAHRAFKKTRPPGQSSSSPGSR